MIGIQEIGSYIPSKRINNASRLNEFNIDENFLEEKLGTIHLAVKSEDEETSDLCKKAYENLLTKSDIKVSEIECVVVCTQNPDGKGLPHTSAIVHEKLGFSDSCAVFDISLGCSGYVYSLSIIESFMNANGFKKGILFTADPYSKIINKKDKNTSLIFGDGATATLISETPKWKTGKFLFGSHGEAAPSIIVNKNDGLLSMNGRAVFTFAATTVPKNIISMLESNDLKVEDIDCFALHQGSRYIVTTIKNKLGVDENKVPFVASDYGNTISSSIPLILNGLNETNKHIVISGFGVGLSWASTVLFKI